MKEIRAMKQIQIKRDNGNLMGKMKDIYKWHNGLALESKLKQSSGDSTFKYLPNTEPEEYLFINENNDFVVIDNNGNLQSRSTEVTLSFLISCKVRLSRTKEMFNQLQYN